MILCFRKKRHGLRKVVASGDPISVEAKRTFRMLLVNQKNGGRKLRLGLMGSYGALQLRQGPMMGHYRQQRPRRPSQHLKLPPGHLSWLLEGCQACFTWILSSSVLLPTLPVGSDTETRDLISPPPARSVSLGSVVPPFPASTVLGLQAHMRSSLAF